MTIRTKIVATMGPACSEKKVIRQLVDAGVDVFRINFSHGTPETHETLLAGVRAVEADCGEPLAVMADLCGPKIRVGSITGGSVLLGDGQSLTIQREVVEGSVERVSTTLPELVDQVTEGEVILLDDGNIRLQVTDTSSDDAFVCKVTRGGVLAGGKGVNLPHTSLQLSGLTEKDRRDVAWIAAKRIDYVAQSFVRSADDVAELRAVLADAGAELPIVAKIEKPEAVENIESIVRAADAIMVARGDLGVEMDLPAVPVAQKNIARLCRVEGKPCIIATQMLETMTHSPTPTRAEVSDVANAVLDHADAVMLSGETAIGKYPVQTVAMMNSIVASIQSYDDRTSEAVRIDAAGTSATAAALADSVRSILAADDIVAIAVFTISGATARMFAKQRPACPILGLSPDPAALRRMCLYYGVLARKTDVIEHTDEVLATASRFAVEQGIAERGDKIVVVCGRPLGRSGTTNSLVVHTIP